MPTGVFPRNEVNTRTCFKPGQAPWNKGTKYQIGQGRFVRTDEFRKKQSESHKGQIPWNKGLFGSKSHTWKGGKTGLSFSIRNSEEYKKWRADVYRRDGWTCQTCGYRGHGKDIEAHHIIPMKELIKEAHVIEGTYDDKYIFAMSIPKMFDISNGVTLCEPCHILTYKGERK